MCSDCKKHQILCNWCVHLSKLFPTRTVLKQGNLSLETVNRKAKGDVSAYNWLVLDARVSSWCTMKVLPSRLYCGSGEICLEFRQRPNYSPNLPPNVTSLIRTIIHTLLILQTPSQLQALTSRIYCVKEANDVDAHDDWPVSRAIRPSYEATTAWSVTLVISIAAQDTEACLKSRDKLPSLQ